MKKTAFVEVLDKCSWEYDTVTTIQGIYDFQKHFLENAWNKPPKNVTLFAFDEHFPAMGTTDILCQVVDVNSRANPVNWPFTHSPNCMSVAWETTKPILPLARRKPGMERWKHANWRMPWPIFNCFWKPPICSWVWIRPSSRIIRLACTMDARTRSNGQWNKQLKIIH